MQHTMDDDPVQLALIAAAKSLRIVLDAFDANAKLAGKHRFTIGQRKGDNVGVEVVTKSFPVDFQ